MVVRVGNGGADCFAYIASLTGANDDFFEDHVLNSQIYAIAFSGQTIGLCGVYGQENLTFFHILTKIAKKSPASKAER